MHTLYEYKKKLPHLPHGRGSQKTLIIDGEREFVDAYIKPEEFCELFGGFLHTLDVDAASETFQYRGVWGKDKVRKFKSVLRERGAEFSICKIDGAGRFIKVTSQQWSSEERNDSVFLR